MSEHSWYLAGAIVVLAVVVTLLTTIASPAASAPEQATIGPSSSHSARSPVWHQVQEGEHLRSISLHYYGSGRHWRTLQIANNVDHYLPPGTMLLIPGMRDELDGVGQDLVSLPATPTLPTVATGQSHEDLLSRAGEDP